MVAGIFRGYSYRKRKVVWRLFPFPLSKAVVKIMEIANIFKLFTQIFKNSTIYVSNRL